MSTFWLFVAFGSPFLFLAGAWIYASTRWSVRGMTKTKYGKLKSLRENKWLSKSKRFQNPR